ncbi:MAG: CoF synthetase [Legionellales bacterium RIFCSPHIGHO2_12_FULL_42_9]|nr:MAG: CoF synthetase [Legionellales bacterium RIFCSPHIGHO2_12_FULL_42_9]
MNFKRIFRLPRRAGTEALTARQTHDMMEDFPNHYNNLYCSSDALQTLRNTRLQSLLHYAKTNSPWYKKEFAHIDIDTITEQNLAELPSLNKVTLMNNWDDIVTDRRLSLKLVEKHLNKISEDENLLYLFEKYHVVTTSGSSGIRGVLIYDWEEWNQFYIQLIRYGLYHRDGTEILPDPAKKTRIAIVNISNQVFATYSFHKTFYFNDREKFHFPITLPFEQIIAGLNQVQPDMVIGLPPTLYQLCQEARHGRLTIEPKVVVSFGEPLYRTIRSLIKKTWPNGAIFNTYSSSEGLIGMNCHADSHEMHLNDDGCIVQLVDDLNNPVGKNKMSGKVYITNLYNYTLPIIRYELADQLIFLDKRCECGINHQLIAEPLYRPEFDFIYQGSILVHHYVFVTPILLEKNIREYQVIQTENGVDVKVVLLGVINKTQLQQAIADELSRQGLSQPEVKIIEVLKIDYPPSGKLRRFLRDPALPAPLCFIQELS